MTKSIDTEILEIALCKLSEAFDRLVSDCIDDKGNPRQPDRKTIMQSRACLPPSCENAFKKKDRHG